MAKPRTVTVELNEGELGYIISVIMVVIQKVPESMEYELLDNKTKRLIGKGTAVELIKKLKSIFDGLDAN